MNEKWLRIRNCQIEAQEQHAQGYISHACLENHTYIL
jgi:hypothetical protein